MTTAPERRPERQPLSEVVKGPQPKPPLGPPHDAWATIGLGVFFASGLLFTGYVRTEGDWIGWTGFALSFAALIAAGQYFIRAYGFNSRGWSENVPTGAYFAAFFAFFFVTQMVAPAVYSEYAGRSTMALIASFLALSAMAVAPLRMALGRAAPEPPSQDSSNSPVD